MSLVTGAALLVDSETQKGPGQVGHHSVMFKNAAPGAFGIRAHCSRYVQSPRWTIPWQAQSHRVPAERSRAYPHCEVVELAE